MEVTVHISDIFLKYHPTIERCQEMIFEGEATLGDITKLLNRKYPKINFANTLIAVNRQLVALEGHQLSDGDVVNFFPPALGG